MSKIEAKTPVSVGDVCIGMGSVTSEAKVENHGAPPNSANLKHVVEERLEAIHREREKMEESLRRIEREVESLSSTVQKATMPAPETAKTTERQQLSDDQRQKLKDLADRSKWSPQLRKLIEDGFPEEGKEERIRRALEAPLVNLGGGLTKEQARYCAEDVDLEYDV